MAEKEAENTSDETTDEKKKKGGMKKFIFIGLALVLVGGAGGGGYYYLRGSSAAAAEAPNKKNDKKSKTESDDSKASDKKDSAKKGDDPLENALPDDEDVKKIVELPPVIVNLADTEQARYLRMTISLGVNDAEKAGEKPDQLFMTRVRNAILAVVSDKRSEEILSVEGKSKLRKELLKAAQAASDDPQVKAIYITDFIVQL